MKVKNSWLIGLLLMVFLVMASAIPAFADENTAVTMEFKNADIRDVLRTLSQMAGVNLITHQTVQGEVTLSLKQVPFKEAIRLITLMNDLDYRWVGNTILVGKADKLKEVLAEGEVKTFTIQYAQLDKVKEMLETLLVGIKVSIDSRTHSVTVIGDQRIVQKAAAVIQNIDIPIPQVFLDVRVEEISKTGVAQLGTRQGEYAKLKFLTDSTGFITDLAVEIPTIIEALKKEGLAKTLANPGLVALDGQPARLLIGDKIPVEAQEEVDGKTRNVIKYIEAGIKLEFIPRVSNDGYITLDVKPQVSSLGESLTKGYPLIRTREVETVVRIRDGQTFVIGGLIREEDRQSFEKVPILGDIPILGALFSHKDSSKQTTEIVIVITPRIIYPAQTQAEAGVQVKSQLIDDETEKTNP